MNRPRQVEAALVFGEGGRIEEIHAGGPRLMCWRRKKDGFAPIIVSGTGAALIRKYQCQ